MLLQPPVATSVGANRVEVIEFFDYGCSYCYNFESFLEVWSRRKPPNVELLRVPVLYGKREPFARLYYTLLRLGRIGGPRDIHHEIFDAIHRVGLALTDADERKAFKLQRDYVSSHGVDAREFEKIYYSPEVEADLHRAEERAREMQVTSWPVVVINGKFKTHATLAGGERKLVRVINELATLESRLLSASRSAPGG